MCGSGGGFNLCVYGNQRVCKQWGVKVDSIGGGNPKIWCVSAAKEMAHSQRSPQKNERIIEDPKITRWRHTQTAKQFIAVWLKLTFRDQSVGTSVQSARTSKFIPSSLSSLCTDSSLQYHMSLCVSGCVFVCLWTLSWLVFSVTAGWWGWFVRQCSVSGRLSVRTGEHEWRSE